MTIAQDAAVLPSSNEADAVTSSGIASGLRARWLVFSLTLVAGVLLIGSMFLPYWEITLHAPQYPRGLHVTVWVDHMGDERQVFEVDGLNHYIGMMSLADAAEFERSISPIAIPLVALLAFASFFLKGWWKTIARIPLVIYPVIFFVDLFAWLYYAGHNLDETAALSSSIHEFTPHIIGKGEIGQFSTQANFTNGYYVAIAASILMIVAWILDRKRGDEAV